MPLWLTALVVLAAWTLAATALGLALARLIHRNPARGVFPALREERGTVTCAAGRTART
ncbi:hypothetical protein [Streptomyces sp. NPDC001568]|uniref:hypothetical protein n=1 Tax=Streptomyces sp. NPDC001568 TaxID=3364588 RepID=UPI0036BB0C4A